MSHGLKAFVALSSRRVRGTWERRSSRQVIFHNHPSKNWISVDCRVCRLCRVQRYGEKLLAPPGVLCRCHGRLFTTCHRLVHRRTAGYGSHGERISDGRGPAEAGHPAPPFCIPITARNIRLGPLASGYEM
jgi:hypothetical protein